MILWNGQDIDTFLEILACIDKNEAVEVAVEGIGVKNVASFDDLRKILPPRNENTEITKQEYEELLRTFLPSKEMREHLLKHKLNRYQVMDLMLASPVPLETKAAFFKKLTCREDLFHAALDKITSELLGRGYETEEKIEFLKWDFDDSFTSHFKDIRLALDSLELKPGEILLLNEAWYDEDLSDENESRRSVPMLSLDAALKYVRDEMKEEEWNDETECWTVLDKWSSAENGEMEHLYTYYLIRDEIVLFEKTKPTGDDRPYWSAHERKYSRGWDLNLPIPYKPGDIVEVNCLPFAPVKHVLLLTVGDDCCGVTALFRREDGKWDTGALKHGHCWERCRPLLSPLYRIRSNNKNILFEGEGLLLHVQKYISGDSEKGKKHWDDIIYRMNDELTENELRYLIGDKHGDDVLLEYRRCSGSITDNNK
ncbi:MAG: hypothetical protein IJS94_01725 [Clostridia bacterium]|nr:hypothetical protein [Clostridia bacterium]